MNVLFLKVWTLFDPTVFVLATMSLVYSLAKVLSDWNVHILEYIYYEISGMKKVSEYVKYIRIIMRSRCYVILSSWCDLFICWCGSGKCLTKENGWWINLSAVEMLLINEFKNPSYPDMSLNEYSICSDRLYGEQILLLCWCVFVVHLWELCFCCLVSTCTFTKYW